MQDDNSSPRRTYRRAASGAYWRDLAHPVIPGKRYKIRARTKEGLDSLDDLVKRVGAEVRLGMITREKALERLARRARRPPTLAEIYKAHRAVSPPTAHQKLDAVWNCQLEPFFGKGVLSSALSEERMAEWERWALGQGYASNTLRLTIEILRPAYRRARLEIPWGSWRPRSATVPREYEKAKDVSELVALLRAAAARDVRVAMTSGRLADLMIRVLVLTLCALRKGEGAALGWDNAPLDRAPPVLMNVVHNTPDQWRRHHPDWTRPIAPVKQRPARAQSLILHPWAILALRWQRDELRRRGWYREDGPIFPAARGAWRANPELIPWSVWRALARDSGVPNARNWVVHSLRHSAASLEADGGATIAEIGERTRHGSLAIVEHYIKGTGRGLPHSRIGGVEPPQPAPLSALDVEAVLIELHETILRAQEEGLRARKPVLDAAREKGRATFEAHARARSRLRGLSLAELARESIAKGDPKSHRDEAHRRRSRAYMNEYARVMRETESRTEASKRARARSAAADKAWKRALARALVAARGTSAAALMIEETPPLNASVSTEDDENDDT